ncbi:PREDICTED: uncharacterized protein LOC109163057 [Ipomoea nil]|uniref:uncharacterized protein LOC109163057 n=1 Tax=Ipomoea nil TaxID=35883 RepID=UPI000901D188|nr:PREDICTED: uncharacterized protein LOC109163057 [Ipomoea nil]
MEHTVVRGFDGGRNITTSVVYHNDDYPGPSSLNGLAKDYRHEPPDPNMGLEKEHRHNPPDPMIGLEGGYSHEPPDPNLEHPTEGACPEETMLEVPKEPADFALDAACRQRQLGAASTSFKRSLKLLLAFHRPSFICLLEPKVSSNQANKLCSGFGFDEWIRVEAVGFSGGIGLLWKKSVTINVINTHPQYISVQVMERNLEPCYISMVYGSPDHQLRKRLFSDLSGNTLDPQGSWMTAGDFNSITCREEVSNPENFNYSRCSDFNEWIFNEGLVDLGYMGSMFTWMRGINSDSFKGARLDRALGNVNWKLQFPNTSMQHLPITGSDHSPLLIDTRTNQETNRPKSFKFNMAWATHTTFKAVVDANWNKNLDLESNKSKRKKRLIARIEGIQRKVTQSTRSDLIKLNRKLQMELEETLYQEELIWFQRSREEWITSGYRNTRHGMERTGFAPYTRRNQEELVLNGSLQSPVTRWGCNDTLISLIPKVPNPTSVKQYRPISLCNVSYKLITKIMASRLKNMSRKLIGPHQTSFVPGRQISDNVLLYQEVLSSMKNKKGKSGWMVMKIDLEKAYDKLSWDFIKDTVEDIGLNDTWTKRILECVSSPRLAVLVNRQKMEWFKPTRGIRQGDSISPLIFVLCIERLSHIIQSSINSGHWKGIKLSRQGPHITHLFFADDLVLFGEATEQQALEMKTCLDTFCKCSGQKLSLQKSTLFFSKNTEGSLQQRIAAVVGIPIVSNMGNYLGIPSFHGRIKNETFAGVLERIQSRLAGWKSRTLSFAGRITLVQSVLISIPFYYMQTILLPTGVISNIEKLIRGFLWGSNEGERRCHLINWETVTRSKTHGGLGIRKLDRMNLAFLAKLGWRLLQDEESLWSRVFKNDRWILDTPLFELATNYVPISERNRSVASYWSLEEGWLWNQFDDFLPTEVLDKLAAVILSEDQNEQDSTHWSKETT